MENFALEIKNVGHYYKNGNKKKHILQNVNLKIPEGQFVSLVGPSGCGKSTLLRSILGTHPASTGEIYTDGVKIVRPNRHVGIVYQHYSLYDFLSAENNVAFGLAQDQSSLWYRTFGYLFWRKTRKKHLEQSREMLKKVCLQHAIKLYPAEMSGGMKQRVAIAQALIMKPKIILLDEPFGALDESTREELQCMMIDFHNENQTAIKNGEKPPYTVVIVTHELNEAIYLSDRIIGLSQYHPSGENGATIVYDKPATAFDKNSEKDYSLFLEQKEEIRRIVFNFTNKEHQ